MTDTTITITAVLGFLAGAMSIGMWLGPALSRVRTERDRLQSTVDYLRAESDAMTDKIAKLTADCVEFQRLAHKAEGGLRRCRGRISVLSEKCVESEEAARDAREVSDRWETTATRRAHTLKDEIASHNATKRQLAAARGQITKLKRRIEAARHLNADDVQWIVNSIAELGVLINGQAFFLYKGRSLVYETVESEESEGGIMMYRPVFKREFGECCHPVNYSDPTKIGTVSLSDSDDWMPLPEPPQ